MILLSLLLLLILVMGSWVIVHPDTLGYHAQTIQWIEKYKAVPGLVHLHVRFGYQGLWFVDCALFDFSFTGKQGITFLNTTVLFWFLIFIVNRIDYNFFKSGKRVYGLLWLGLLALSLSSYTQTRLTATSASPDFIATVFVLLITYLVFEKGIKRPATAEWIVLGVVSIVAVTIKLSVAPVLLIALSAVVLFLSRKNYRSLFFLLVIGSVAFFAFVTRNIITSGYVAFPQTTIDIASVDWKYDTERTAEEKNYITAYAKKQGVVTKSEIDTVNQMTAAGWLPGWWKNRSFADKTIFVLLLISLFAALIFLKRIIHSGFTFLLVLMTMVTGIVFWFINAPDPRFGFGFILGFITSIAYMTLKERDISISNNLIKIILIGFCLGTSTYVVYRISNFFNSGQLVAPSGIPSSPYRTIDCGGIKFNSPITAEFGTTPVPCTDLGCEHFTSRGNSVDDGFGPK